MRSDLPYRRLRPRFPCRSDRRKRPRTGCSGGGAGGGRSHRGHVHIKPCDAFTEAGVREETARAVAADIPAVQDLATKADLEKLELAIANMRGDMMKGAIGITAAIILATVTLTAGLTFGIVSFLLG